LKRVPKYIQSGEALKLLRRQHHKVVGRGSHDAKRRLALKVKFYFGGARRSPRKDRYEFCRKVPLLETTERAVAAFIIADGADKDCFVPQFLGVCGKVQGSAAQVFVGTDHIPQNFSHADNSHQ